MDFRWICLVGFVFTSSLVCSSFAEVARPESIDEIPFSELGYDQRMMKACEMTVSSETCSQFRLDRPDLKDQFLTCDSKNLQTLPDVVACGKGLWGAAKDYLSIFEAPKLSPLGETFIEFQKTCFADLACREKTYLEGVGKSRRVSPDELKKLAKVPESQRLQVQPFYYGQLEQLKGMKATELRVIAMGLDPVSPEGLRAMRESYPNWKPELRVLYAPEGWGESAYKSVSAIAKRLKEIGVELRCLDTATVTEMICFGGGLLVDPLVAVKAVTVLPKAYKVVSKLIRADGLVKSAAVLRIEKKWGRQLTAQEMAAVDRAHMAGTFELAADGTKQSLIGKDGVNVAQVGNFTPSQLRQKYQELKRDFTPDQIRDLMEEGAVGLTPRELAQIRMREMAQANKAISAKALLNKPADKTRRIVADSAPSKEYVNATMNDLSKVESKASDVIKEVDALGKDMQRFPELQDLKKQLAGYEERKDKIFENWNEESKISTDSTRKEIAALDERIERAKFDVNLWKKRASANNWDEIRENPLVLVPDRVYSVKTDRGESIKVSFNDRVIREMVWEGSDDLRARAGETSVEAITRGWQTREGANGISTVNLDGDKFIKIHITGKALGAYRIYGMEKNGVIHFVNWEHESLHDSKYLRRAYQNTLRSFEQLPGK